MTDDLRAKPSSSTGYSDVQAMDRRQSGKAQANRGEARAAAVIARESVRSFMEKLLRRFVEEQRPFSVVAVNILEHGHLLETLGAGAADLVGDTARTICRRSLRGSDRVCFVQPGHCLILLTDTNTSQARTVMRRVAVKIAQAKLNFQGKVLRASADYAVTGLPTSDERPLSPHVEALLNELGYGFDGDGYLRNTQQVNGPMRKERVFSGNHKAWSERYSLVDDKDKAIKKFQFRGIKCGPQLVVDRWRNGSPLLMTECRMPHPLTPAELERLSHRMRMFQRAEVAHVVPLLDFHASDDDLIMLIEPLAPNATLQDRDVTLPRVLDWGVQLATILISLQNLVPAVVLPAVEEENLFLAGEQLILAHCALPYIFTPLQAATAPEGGSADDEAAARLAGLAPAQSLLKLLNRLLKKCDNAKRYHQTFAWSENDRLPDPLNGLHKIRAMLKKALDEESRSTGVQNRSG